MGTDPFNVRVVVIALAAAVLVGLAFMGFLAVLEKPIPDPFDRLVTFLAGGLTAVLVSTKVGVEQPQEVTGPEVGETKPKRGS